MQYSPGFLPSRPAVRFQHSVPISVIPGRPSRMFPTWASYDFGEVGNTLGTPDFARAARESGTQ